jgi:hypothetical protein
MTRSHELCLSSHDTRCPRSYGFTLEEPESSRSDEHTDEFLELIHVGKEAVPLRAVGDDDESLQRKERSSHIFARYHRTDIVTEHLFHRG